jgi:cytosine/adenosine deaminase-related metal-dependent hydrolase
VAKGAAACIGWPELGGIAIGKAPDLALFKLDELRFSGHGDPIASWCGGNGWSSTAPFPGSTSPT